MHDSGTRVFDDATSRAIEAAREATRNEIGFDLHDGVLQPLMALVTSLECLQRQQAGACPPAPGVGACLSLAREAASSLRFALSGLLVHPHAQASLPAAVAEHLAPWLGEWGVRVYLEVADWPDDVAVETTSALYLAVREALTNAWKHAGAGDVHVRLEGEATCLRVSIRDEGAGLAKTIADSSMFTGHGWGLSSMEGRLRALGGEVTIRSNAVAGVLVQMRAPYDRSRGPIVGSHPAVAGRTVSALTQ